MGTQYGPENTGPVRRYGAGGAPGPGILSMPGAETLNVLWVDKGLNPAATADGSVQLPYHSIDVAVNAALALVPTASNPVAIIVMSGVYAEQVTLDTDYVYLFGWDRESTILRHTATPLTITSEYTAVRGMTLESTLAGARAIAIDTGVFATAPWIEECTIVVPDLANTSVYTTGGSAITFKDCSFIGADEDVDIYFQDDVDDRLELWECRVTGSFDFDAGSFFFKGCEIDGQVLSIAVGDIQVFDCRLSYPAGSPFMSTKSGVEIRDCVFETNAASYDIDANGGNSTSNVIENNVFSGLGMDPDFGTTNPTKFIGASGMTDYYGSLAAAMTQLGNDPVIVELLADQTVTAAVTPGVNGPLTFKGNGHTVTRAAGGVVFDCGGPWVRFRNINIVGEVDVAGAAPVEFLEGTFITGRINNTGGNAACEIILDGCTIVGDAFTGHCMRLRANDPNIYIRRSYLKGASGNPAIYHQTAHNDKVHIKYSTIWHGSGGANLPIGRSGAQVMNYYSHHNRYNTDPTAGGWLTNLIAVAQRFNSYDVQTDY